MFGIFNISKPAGFTSRDVVNIVQKRVRPAKAGHAGTLDPLATGVLVVCVGPATRLIEYVQRMPKSYRGTFLLGRQSDTEDIEGNVTELPDVAVPSRDKLEATLRQFVGNIQQRPPAYSALMVKGERAYKLAREGKDVELPSRPITIFDITLVDFDYPEFTIDVQCGSGTYIRSLGRDIGIALGTAAVMSALVRTGVGVFTQREAVSIDQIKDSPVGELLLPPSLAVSNLPRLTLGEEQWQMIRNGRTIPRPNEVNGAEIAAVNEDGTLLSILKSKGAKELAPLRNFV